MSRHGKKNKGSLLGHRPLWERDGKTGRWLPVLDGKTIIYPSVNDGNAVRSWPGDTTYHHKGQPEDDTFRCVVDEVTACSRAGKPHIWIEPSLWYAMIDLCEKFHEEWLAYLVGKILPDGMAEVTDIYFPPQVAGPAHVHNQPLPDFTTRPDTIGAIHSHVQMQAFFSGTDAAHANWPVEIVLNAKGEYQANIRLALPCGSTMRKEAKVVLYDSEMKSSLETGLKTAFEAGKVRQAEEDARRLPSHYSDDFRPSRLLTGGKYEDCPICKEPAQTCPHTVEAMDEYAVTHPAAPPTMVDAHDMTQLCPICYSPVGHCGHVRGFGGMV